MFQDLVRSLLINLRRVLQWIDIPIIFISYSCVIVYFTVFRFSWVLVVFLSLSLLSFIYQNGIWRTFKLCLILFVFSSICLGIRYQEEKAFATDHSVSKMIPLLDTIQVDGDQVRFRAKHSGRLYQVFYRLPTKEMQTYFQTIATPIELEISATIEKAGSKRNFNGFNYRQYLKTQNIYRIITIDKITAITKINSWDIRYLRRKLILFCEKQFPHPLSSYMTGLLFGQFGQSFDEMETIYTSLGIMHFFTLSGMQVSFLYNSLRHILLRCGLQRHIVTVLLIPIILIYGALAGGAISVVRASIQKGLSACGITSLNNFSVTLLLLFIWQPKFLLTTGGALSTFFVFVVSIVGYKIKQETKIKNKVMMTILLSTASLPLLMHAFYSFQPVALLLTLPLSFLFASLMLPCLSISFFVSISTGISLNQLNICFIWLETAIQSIEKLTPRPMVIGKPSTAMLIIMFITIGVLIDRWSNQKIRFALMMGFIGMCLLTKYPIKETITVVDIGQGDSIFLQDRFNQHTILIDTGGKIEFMKEKKWQKGTKKHNAESNLIPYLKSIGVGKIDTLVVTHTDADHIGDLLTVLANIPVQKIVVSQGSLTNKKFVAVLKQTKTTIQVAEVGQQFPIFDSYLEILYPKLPGDGKNNDSLVLYGVFYQTKFLFTGDLESEGEATLLNSYPLLSVDVLKAGHHGSKTSSAKTFIKTIKPKIALISCGLNNRYRHPNQETLDTFQSNQIAVYRTDRQGAIKFQKNGKSWHIKTVK